MDHANRRRKFGDGSERRCAAMGAATPSSRREVSEPGEGAASPGDGRRCGAPSIEGDRLQNFLCGHSSVRPVASLGNLPNSCRAADGVISDRDGQ